MSPGPWFLKGCTKESCYKSLRVGACRLQTPALPSRWAPGSQAWLHEKDRGVGVTAAGCITFHSLALTGDGQLLMLNSKKPCYSVFGRWIYLLPRSKKLTTIISGYSLHLPTASLYVAIPNSMLKPHPVSPWVTWGSSVSSKGGKHWGTHPRPLCALAWPTAPSWEWLCKT